MIVKGINTVATLLNQGIDAITAYVKNNGFAIAILLGIVWFLKNRSKLSMITCLFVY
jgi:hypothetical protein